MTSDATITFYAQAADRLERQDRHGKRIGAQFGAEYDPRDNPDGFRAYVLAGKFRRRYRHWEQNVFGHWHWFADKQFDIMAAILAEIDAGHVLSTARIATMTHSSRGYVSKTIARLARWRFIDLVMVVRGRIGGITARLTKRLRQMFPPRNVHDKCVNGTYVQGGNISGPRYPGWGRGEPKRLEFEAEMAALGW
jgi:hypothetical protein